MATAEQVEQAIEQMWQLYTSRQRSWAWLREEVVEDLSRRAAAGKGLAEFSAQEVGAISRGVAEKMALHRGQA